MWFLFALLPIVCVIFAIAPRSKKEKKEVALPDDRSIKVKHMLAAKEIISKDEKVKTLMESLSSIYENEENESTKLQKEIIMNMLREIVYDHDTLTAVCAVAKIEANKRRKTKNVKRYV